jgi:sugar transferase (PEP-CTERM/EpsH1 system associated)
MNILLLSPWLPWPPFGGALIRTFETLSYLSRRNRVTLLAPLRHPEEAKHISTLNGLCERVITTPFADEIQTVLLRLAMGLLQGRPLIQSLHYDPKLARQIHRLTSQEVYDIIHVEFSFMSPYLAFVSPRSQAKKVLSMHNIESLRFQRELKFARGARRLALLSDQILFKCWEEKSLCQFDGILAVSPSDQAWLRQHAPAAALELIPNGVDTDYFSAADGSHANRSIVFTALMNYPPNIDAVVWFCDEILPILQSKRPEVSFKIVGDKPGPTVLALAQRNGVQVTGRVPDVRPYLSDSSALVVPLRSGGGTRLKILEAMAMGRPVVSTRLGAEGLEITHGVNILLADTPEEFAKHIFALLADPQLGRRLGSAGRNLVETKYDWSICLSNVEDFYQTLLGSSPAAARPTETRSPYRQVLQ